MRHKSKNGIERIRARNNTYAFAVSRASEEKPATIQFLEQLGADSAIDAQIADIERDAKGVVLGAYSLWGTPVAQLVKSRDFRIQRAINSGADGKEVVRVEFEREVDDRQAQLHFQIKDGYVICDPGNEWSIIEYGGTYHNKINNSVGDHRWTVELGDPIDGMPVATKVVGTIALTGGTTVQTTLATEITDRQKVPEDEFFLRHYGLPEPTFQRRWLGMWVWYLGAAIVLFSAALILAQRRHRKSG